MPNPSPSPVYDTIGGSYCHRRSSDPRIARQINDALGDAQTICNIGAGTGSYEPEDREVVAVEPSQTMINQRNSRHRFVQASAESLPFPDSSFDAAMAIMSVHHWKDPAAGFSEMRRVASRQVVFTFDPERQADLWLVSDYLPEILKLDQARTISIDDILSCLPGANVKPVPIPWDCIDGFQGAYWRRPEMYLKDEVRACISTLAQLPRKIVDRAIQQLAKDLEDGTWQSRYSDLLTLDEFDSGYRLIVADCPS